MNNHTNQMNHNNHSSDNIPTLRFPEFTGEWEMKKLGEVLKRYSIINKDEEFKIKDILSLSSTLGIVKRNEIMDGVYDKVNHKNYIKTSINDIVYGKSISSKYPFGLFKVNNCADGLLSTLYFTFKVQEENLPNFLDNYFNYDNRANNFLRQFVLVGDRYITADANYILSGSIFFPTLPEQSKIAEFLTAIDAKIQALKTKKEKLQQYKKGVMQQLFTPSELGLEGLEDDRMEEEKNPTILKSKKSKFRQEDGTAFPEWEMKKLGEVGKFYAGGDLDKLYYNKIQDEKYCYPIYANGAGEGIYGYATTFQYNTNCVTVSGGGNLGYANARTQKFNAIVRLIVIEPKEFINPKFLEEIINQTRFSIESTGVPQLTVPQISSYKISIPSLPEQTKIANFLSSIDEKINHTETQIEQTQAYKKGLLQKMFV